jgi:hypothetical protein
MARSVRIEFLGAYYHVMARGNRREAIFLDHDDRRFFLQCRRLRLPGHPLAATPPEQKVWVHRRKLSAADAAELARRISGPTAPYLPAAPHPLATARALAALYRVYWYFGQDDLARARDQLELAFAVDTRLHERADLLARQLRDYSRRLDTWPKRSARPEFVSWSLSEVRRMNRPLARRLASALRGVEGP